ncbi:MAG: MarR family winged helix-turn-helix transcriptional regulator [Bacillota bacterium]
MSQDVNAEVFAGLLKSVNRRMFGIAHTVLQQYGLPHSGMAIVGQILKAPGSTVSEVARRTGFAKSHVSKTVDTLSDQGFIEKRQDPSDQRLVRLFATDNLKERFSAMRDVMDHCMSEVLSVFPKQKLDSLVDGLKMLNAALQEFQHRPDAAPSGAPSDVVDDIDDDPSDRFCKRMISDHATSDDAERIMDRLSRKV